MSNDEIYYLLCDEEKENFKYSCQEVKTVFRQNANLNLLRKFNDTFKKDSDGKRREWRDIEEENIKEYFDASKK